VANTARITQSVVEVLEVDPGSARITQSVVELLVTLGISCNNPPPGMAGIAYTHTFTAGSGDPPYTFSITVGVLPTGLILDPATGIASGIPAATGTFSFTVTVTDSLTVTASVVCSILISGPPTPLTTTSGGLPIAVQGCKPRNQWDWCMWQEALKIRRIKFPPLCSIPKEFRNGYPLPWADDFGTNAVPEQSVPFNKTGGIVTPATAAGDQIVISERVPQGYDGLLLGAYWFYTGSGFLEGSGDIVWRVQLVQRFLEDLGNIQFQMGSSVSPMPMTEGQILLSGQVVRILVNVPNLSGMIQIGASQVVAGLIGFYWPR
jgi:hypothetical protein